jgi:hypothetical protein
MNISRSSERECHTRCLFIAIGVLFVCLPIVAPCAAQEVEGSGKRGAAVFSPADYMEVSAPITNGIAANAYGFYLGNIRATVALLEVPLSAQKHFKLTPSYLSISVPPSGLSLLTGEPDATSYHENQVRLTGTFVGTVHGFTMSDGNMYVRRFTPIGDVNRYRNKLFIARPLAVGGYRLIPFIFDEVYHDFAPGRWLRRNWFVAAVDMPINRYLTFQPSYIRQDDQFLRSIQFLGIGLIVKTGQLFHRAQEGSDD